MPLQNGSGCHMREKWPPDNQRLFSECTMRRVLVLLLAFVSAMACSVPAPAQAQAAGAPDPTFDILEFRVEGNSVLSTREVERAVMPFLGEKRRFPDVEKARKALEDTYQKAGYETVFVDIPEQRVVGGVVRLHVLEGRVGHTRVTGTRYFEPDEIRAAVPQLVAGTVPNFNDMQQELGQVNKAPERQVAPILTPGRVPGTVDVNLSVKEELPLHADLEDDNYASPFTTADRLNASVHYDNLWQRQHSVALNYQLSPQKPGESNVLYATYLARFEGSDEAVSVYGIRSNSNVAVLGSATILGNAKIAGARWILPLGSGADGATSFFHSFTLGIDRKDFAQTNVSALTNALSVLPPITYVPLSASYGATLVRETRLAQLSFGVNTAPRDLFGNYDAKFQNRRVLGNAGYVAWKFDASLDQTLSRRWGAYGHIAGQWTYDPLIPNEQFITGGAQSVRGYRESEISGDRGANATLEARFFPTGHPGPDGKRSLYVCAFGDGAQVRLVDPAGPQISLATIASVGLGMHAKGWRGFHADLDLAKALRDGGHGVSGPITKEGGKRVEASVGYGF
jgi:hemolysin activation/secretion protein